MAPLPFIQRRLYANAAADRCLADRVWNGWVVGVVLWRRLVERLTVSNPGRADEGSHRHYVGSLGWAKCANVRRTHGGLESGHWPRVRRPRHGPLAPADSV